MAITTQQLETFAAQLREVAMAAQQRRLLWLSGSAEWCRDVATLVMAGVVDDDLLWVSTLAPVGVRQIDNIHCTQLLGSELAMVVYDAHTGFDADALGAISGLVRGGGLLLLLTPALAQWPSVADPEARRFMAGADVAERSRFITRLVQRLSGAAAVYRLEQEGALPLIEALAPTPVAEFVDPPCRTADQQQAVAAIIKTAHGHRKRPTVLLSDRGRGKSAALGIAAAQLLSSGSQRIIVTAPRLDATASLFQQAAALLPQAHVNRGRIEYGDAVLEFIAPDELIQIHPIADLLLVDEAAAIPAPMLDALLDHYARIVFATTVHGYEGSGRGFLLRFSETLNRRMPGGQQLRLEQPIRWAVNDPVEAMIFDTLLLNATIADEAQLVGVSVEQCLIEAVDRDLLLQNETLLSQLFGLLVLAHYRTRPNDLRQLLDSAGVMVYVMRYGDAVVGTALVANEGGLDGSLSQAVYEGRRRLHGHLLPQSLASHVGLPDAATLHYRRIMRIAIHPQLQRSGLGSALIERIIADAQHDALDLVGVSFGVTAELFSFWQGLQFQPVRIGLQREQSSGNHSLMMMQPLSSIGEKLHGEAHESFHQRLPYLLADPLRDLDAVITALLLHRIDVTTSLQLSAAEWRDLHTFAHANLGLETVIVPLWQLVQHHLVVAALELHPQEQTLLVSRVLQKNSWSEVCHATGYNGKNEALKALRQIVAQLLESRRSSSP